MGYLCSTPDLMRYADVILPLATPPMTFAADEELWPKLRAGMRVVVQLGTRKFYTGVVRSLHDQPPACRRVKPVVRVIDECEVVTPQQLQLWEWMTSYYICPLGMVMRAALPSGLRPSGYSEALGDGRGKRPTALVPHIGLHPDTGMAPLPELSPAQQRAYGEILDAFAREQVVLLYGVTGSGKTEIYIRLMAERLAAGDNVLYMLPEIALTAQLIERMRQYFGDRVVVYHSRQSASRRATCYRELLASSGGRLIVGVRSSVLLPLPHLSLVVVDEEHENSFKQSDGAPRYQARDTAVLLSGLYGARTLLGSATPSMESYYNALSGKYALVRLLERYGGATPPQILLSDTLRAVRRGERHLHLNKLLADRIEEALAQGRQVMLFQNRRGFAPFVTCGSCGWTALCPDCNVTMSYHKSDGMLRCHYCGYHTPLPSRCPSCGAEELQPGGFGTEKVEETLAQLFPKAVTARLDADTSRTAHSYQRIVAAFERGEADILIGTQMITKGFDFGRVSLVGILNADNLLNYPDFRAEERAFQLMTQVGGRAGRRKEPGTVVIQTGEPAHPLLAQVRDGDYEAMARMQLAVRQAFLYPPYCRLIALTLRHRDPNLLREAAEQLADSLHQALGHRPLGPEAPPVDRIRGTYLLRLLLKIERGNPVAEAKRLLVAQIEALHHHKAYRAVEVLPDVDPQ